MALIDPLSGVRSIAALAQKLPSFFGPKVALRWRHAGGKAFSFCDRPIWSLAPKLDHSFSWSWYQAAYWRRCRHQLKQDSGPTWRPRPRFCCSSRQGYRIRRWPPSTTAAIAI